MSSKQQRIDAIRSQILDVIERNLTIALAAAKAPLLGNEEARGEMTAEEQSIAAAALLPPSEAPMYLHGALKVLGAGTKAAVGEQEVSSKAPVFNVVMPAPSVAAWQQARAALQAVPAGAVIDVEEEPK